MALHPASFIFSNKSWTPLTSVILDRIDEPRELGFGGRHYQVRCHEEFRGERRTIFVAPTGSGKSLVQVFNAAREILDSDYKQKQVFIVPQRNIGNGFSEQKHRILRIDGKEYFWEVEENCCMLNEDLVAKIMGFLLNDLTAKCRVAKSKGVIGGCTAVVSYFALLAAFDKMTDEEKLLAIKNTSFRFDEVHHIAGVDEDDSEVNKLGDLTKFLLDNDGSIHLTTATFFRGDKRVIIGDEYRSGFKVFSVPFLEHWNNLNLRSLRHSYHCYGNAEELLKKIVDRVAAEPDKPPMIIVPSDGSRLFNSIDKWSLVKKLVRDLEVIYGTGKVLDLVTPGRQKIDKERLVSGSGFSAIVTCRIGGEGTDWPACARVHNTVLDGNTLQVIQKLGRTLRRQDGKVDVEMLNYIEHFTDWDDDSEVIRAKLSDRFNAVIAASMLNDAFFPILMPVMPRPEGECDSDYDAPRQVSLEDLYNGKRNELVDDLLRNVLAISWDDTSVDFHSPAIDEIIDRIIDEYEDFMQYDVPFDDIKERLRKEIVRSFNPGVPSLTMSGVNADFIRESGWDKVVREHVVNHSPFASDVDTNDLKCLQKFLENHFRDSATDNKAELLAMPVGCKRPNSRTTIGGALCRFTSKKRRCYDQEFDKAIRKRQIGWFTNYSSTDKKRDILEMKIGCERPNRRTTTGGALWRYTNKSQNAYDPDFDKAIRKRQPGWFIDTVAENKAELLAMPAGCERPTRRTHQLGSRLGFYTNKNGKSYDSEFDKEIRKRQPGWFTNTATEKKKKLLAMPVGCERPNARKGHSLAASISRYTLKSQNAYDPVFDKEIRKRQPGWFVDTAAEKKKELLTMPVGHKRPSSKKSRLGLALLNYTNEKSGYYDPEFDAAIRKRQPGWFKNRKK